MYWIRKTWEEPKYSDYLLMRIAQRVQQVLSKNPGHIQLLDQKVRFQNTATKPQQSIEEATAESKARWLGALGMSGG